MLLTENENSKDVCHNPDFSSFQHWREVIEEIPVLVVNKTCADANDVSASKMKDQLMEKTENIIVSKPVLRRIGSRSTMRGTLSKLVAGRREAFFWFK